MASGPEGTEPLNYQTSVLRVSIHCEGCKKKVKKVLHGLQGVYTIDINSKQNKVTVTGSVDAESLIRRLIKYGKYAELWPEKKTAAANSSGEAAGDAKATAAPIPKTEQQLPNTEKQQQTEEDKTRTTSPPTTEATASAPPPAASISGEAAASKPKIDPRKCNDSDKKDGEKPADASEEAVDGKKKTKIAQTETSSKDEKAVSDSDTAENAAAASLIPSPGKKFPAYAQPIYTLSYSAAQASTSYAYYTSTPAAVPSNYTYSGYPAPENYAFDPYYGSMDAPAASGGSYDMFNDENPNACNLM